MKHIATQEQGIGRASGTPGGFASPEAWIAREAASLLQDSRTGLLLLGEPRQTRLVLRLLVERMLSPALAVGRLAAPGATPAMLRQAAAQARAQAGTTRPDMLLVIEEASQLAAEVLDELELAAEAAAQLGGLTFLLVAEREAGLALRLGARPALAACFATRLVVPPSPGAADMSSRMPLARDSRQVSSLRRMPTILAGSLAVLALAAGVALLVPDWLEASRPGAAPAATGSILARNLADRRPSGEAEPAPDPAVPSMPPPMQPLTETAPLAAARGSSLLLLAAPGDTLLGLYTRVYHGMTPPPYRTVAALNPHLVRPGVHLVFPAPPSGWPGGSR